MAIKVEKVMKTAEKLVRKGKLEAAIKEYRKILTENPNDANTLNRVGDLYVRIERFDEAIKLFSQIAEQYAHDGFHVKAIAIYKKIIKIDPTALKVYERLAELYYLQGLINESRTQYQVLADYYTKHDNATSAITIYQRMSEIDPENPTHFLKLAELYADQSLDDKAVRAYRQLADLFVVGGSLDDAVKIYTKAIVLSNGDPEFVGESLRSLVEGGHREAAAPLMERAIELNPENEALARELGFIQAEPEPAPAPEPEPTPDPEPIFEPDPEPAPEPEAFEEAEVDLGEIEEAEFDLEAIEEPELEEEEIDLDEIELEGDDEEFSFNFDDETNDETGVNMVAEPVSQSSPSQQVMPPVDLEKAAEAEAFTLESTDETDFTAFWESDEPASTQVLPPPDIEKEATGEIEIELDLEGDDDLEWSAEEEPETGEEAAEVAPDPEKLAQRIGDLLAEAQVFAKYGLQPKARARLEELFEIDADHVEALILLAQLELEDDHHDKARELGERIARSASTEEEKKAWEELNGAMARAGIVLEDVAPAETVAPEPSRARLLEDLEAIESSGTMATVAAPAAVEAADDDLDLDLSFDLDADDEPSTIVAPPPELDSPPVDSPPVVEEIPAAPVPPSAAPVAPVAPAPPPAAAPAGGGMMDLDFSDLLDDDDDDVPAPVASSAPAPAPVVAPPVSSPPAVSAPAAAQGNQMFDLAGELGLDDDLSEPAPVAPSAPAPAAVAPPPSLDETGMSWLDDAPEEPKESAHESLFDDEDDFFNLAAELEGDLQEDDDIVLETAQEQSLEEIIEGFKQGVAENLSAEDYDTHFNLGIAYREMGLLDEAIGEFQLAAKDERYMVECSSMLGICFLEKGLPELAVRWYQKGLAIPSIGEQQTLGLLYDMGDVYLSMGDQQSAYRTFVEIYGLNTNYRDVKEKLEQIGQPAE